MLERCADASAMFSNLSRVLDTTVVQLLLVLCVLGIDSSLARERQRTAGSTLFVSSCAQITARPFVGLFNVCLRIVVILDRSPRVCLLVHLIVAYV